MLKEKCLSNKLKCNYLPASLGAEYIVRGQIVRFVFSVMLTQMTNRQITWQQLSTLQLVIWTG